MDRITAIKSISRNLRDLIVDSVPASLTGTSIDCVKLIQPLTNQLKGVDFYIYSGAGAGQNRIVTNFIPANNRSTFDEAFITTPSTNSAFLMFQFFNKDDYDNALDRMVGAAKLRYLEDKVATLALVATQYEYPVPSGFEYISMLRLVPSGNNDYGADDEVNRIFELPPRYWRVEANAVGTYVIVIDSRKIDLDNFNNQWVNVLGQVKADISATDNATIPVALEEYLINGASMLMSSQRITESQEWKTKFYFFRDLVKGLEDYIFRPRYGKRVGA